ncbi:RluA family pseudouridine synthase [Lactiplantibacillus pentosus]|uniref:RluA family pseudouridine synthase n=1 Tax=Lactiplantibacillus pentosus TaxID=1589 RepID=UPI00132F56CC|nr:RluA family pseudouridine synthase [Lactiplantibacillus pentosus]MBU7464872.1 RluA family pseudouridine synthase [Lactiplantibacillus pentosus]MBU7492519.1 RluA family pseudouridine synthase [Lactiplantibacillus pentosus]MBU7518421.1 RluA family pseudouridine synthase [Lactiplantibacillus pentosus]MBU7526549.1 RluA family pseudouridine synthase [Lactiplantibacillus pentosus]MDT6965724.1 RluA family pseudouridine synthase [Lactiplantibacillus pentosus]
MQFTWTHYGEPLAMKRFLTQHGISMRTIKAIKHGAGDFLVNDQVKTGVITINTGDVAGIRLPDEAADETVAVSYQPLQVQYEDANWLVVDKPAGLTSVPGPSNREDTLVNRIKGYLVATQAPNQRPHLITRLDRDTSGLVLVAKHHVAQGMLTDPKLADQLVKTYLAWIEGTLTPASGTIDQPIGRLDDSPRRGVTASGQRAITTYKVETSTLAHAVSRVRLQLVTGRTHQIRVHLSALGHPLLGDALYDGNQTWIKRQALHAASLQFYDPFAEQTRQFEAPLPADLQALNR